MGPFAVQVRFYVYSYLSVFASHQASSISDLWTSSHTSSTAVVLLAVPCEREHVLPPSVSGCVVHAQAGRTNQMIA